MPEKLKVKPFVIIAIVAGSCGVLVALSQLFGAARKIPGEIEAGQKQHEVAKRQEIQQQELQAKQQLEQARIQTESAIQQQRLQADISLQQLERSRPVDTPRVDTNAVVSCSGFNGVNLRREPGGQIAYVLPCNTPVFAVNQEIEASGVRWRRVFYQGLPGWVASNLISDQGGIQQ